MPKETLDLKRLQEIKISNDRLKFAKVSPRIAIQNAHDEHAVLEIFEHAISVATSYDIENIVFDLLQLEDCLSRYFENDLKGGLSSYSPTRSRINKNDVSPKKSSELKSQRGNDKVDDNNVAFYLEKSIDLSY